MRKSLVIVVAFCGAALLSAAGVVAQTDASVVVTPGRTPQFQHPDPGDGRTVITPGPSETLVNPQLRGRRAPSNARRAPRVVPYPDGETGTSVHPGSHPIVVYPEAAGGTTVVIPGRRPVVVYHPIP